jgi:cysteinyl-tRNA synthetase
LSTHYRSPINIEVEERDGRPYLPGVAEAERRLEYFYTTRERLDDALAGGKDPGPGPNAPAADGLIERFGEALDDDFNTALAIATLGETASLANQLLDDSKGTPKDVRRRTLVRLASDLGSMGAELGLLARPPLQFLTAQRSRLACQRGVDEGGIDRLVLERDQARRAKDFARADAIRAELAGQGVELMDTRAGTRWRFSN